METGPQPVEPALDHPNGVERLRNAAHGISTLFAGGLPRRNAAADIGFAFAMAEKSSPHVRPTRPRPRTPGSLPSTKSPTAAAISFRLGGFRVKPNTRLIAKFGAAGHKLGARLGKAYVRGYLASIGINPKLLEEFEKELAKEGVRMG